MGAKISKRGSYNLQKRDKHDKKTKSAMLEERTTSFINLTEAQIYEDEIKTPLPKTVERPKSFDDAYFNHSSVNTNETVEISTLQNIAHVYKEKENGSERYDYSNPDDDQIYTDILNDESGTEPFGSVNTSNSEEQTERKNSNKEFKAISIPKEKKRRTWSQPQVWEEDQHFNARETLSSASLSENYEEIEIGSSENWKKMLSGPFWTDKPQDSLIENSNPDRKAEEQVEIGVDQFGEEPKVCEKTEQVSLVEIKNEMFKENQVEVDAKNLKALKLEENIEYMKELEGVAQFETSTSNKVLNETEQLEKYPLYVNFNGLQGSASKQHEEEAQEEIRDVEGNPNITQEGNWEQIEINENQNLSLSKALDKKVTFKMEEEQLELPRLTSSEDVQKDHREEVTADNPDFNPKHQQDLEVPTSIPRHKKVSRAISVNSDIYELAREGSVDDSECEEQEIFYDAKEFDDFQNEAQVEVTDEMEKPETASNKTRELENLNPTNEQVISTKSNKTENSSLLEEVETHVVDDNGEKDKILKYGSVEVKEEGAETPRSIENFVTVIDEDIKESSLLLQFSDQGEQPELKESKKNNSLEEAIGVKNLEIASENEGLLIDLSEDKPEVLESDNRNVKPKGNEESYDQISISEWEQIELSGNYTKSLYQTATLIDLTDEEEIINQEISCAKISTVKEEKFEVGSKIEDNAEDKGKTNSFETQQENSENNFSQSMMMAGKTPPPSPREDFRASKEEKFEILKDLHSDFMDLKRTNETAQNFSETFNVVQPLNSDLEIPTKEESYEDQVDNQATSSLPLREKAITEDQVEVTKEPPSITTPEEIAQDQMRLWKAQKGTETEEAISQINAITEAINDAKNQINNLGSSERDKEIHAEMYQTLIKIMRDVNNINNHDFNENVIDLQHKALNEVHGCLKELQLKKFS